LMIVAGALERWSDDCRWGPEALKRWGAGALNHL
jgi:hypothetical protein